MVSFPKDMESQVIRSTSYHYLPYRNEGLLVRVKNTSAEGDYVSG